MPGMSLPSLHNASTFRQHAFAPIRERHELRLSVTHRTSFSQRWGRYSSTWSCLPMSNTSILDPRPVRQAGNLTCHVLKSSQKRRLGSQKNIGGTKPSSHRAKESLCTPTRGCPCRELYPSGPPMKMELRTNHREQECQNTAHTVSGEAIAFRGMMSDVVLDGRVRSGQTSQG
jgi:hypothetical protein